MRVKEIMSKDVSSVAPDDNVKDTLAVLLKMQISGLPVIDAQGKLVGMFTEKEILARILPTYVEKVGRFIYEENPKSIKKKFAELNMIKISQLMRRDVVTTREDVTLCEVARLMLTLKARRIPVIDQGGRVVGIVARCDVLNAFTREAEAAGDSPK